MSAVYPLRPTSALLATEPTGGRLRRFCVLLLCTLLAFAPRVALGALKEVVLVVADIGSSEQPSEADLVGALRGQLRELEVSVLVVRAAREPLAIAARRAKQIAAREAALAVFWLETSGEQQELFLYDASGHLYSRVVESDGSTASQSEAVAVVLRFAIQALLEGGSIGMSEVALQPAPPPVEPAPTLASPPRAAAPPREEAGTELRAGVSYVSGSFIRGARWQHGVALLVSVRPARSNFFFGADYTYFPSEAVAAEGIRIQLRRRPGEVFAGWELGSSRLRVDLRGALGADYVQRRTAAVRDDWLATPDASRWLWTVSPRLGLTLAVSRRLHGFLTLGADVVLNPFALVAAPETDRYEAFGSLLRVRPRVEVGLMISAW